jgi:hypothetical protein
LAQDGAAVFPIAASMSSTSVVGAISAIAEPARGRRLCNCLLEQVRVVFVGLGDLRADDRSEDHSRGEAGRAEQSSECGAGGEPLDAAELGDVQSFVDVDVVTGERAAQNPVPVVVMFDEADLTDPGRGWR